MEPTLCRICLNRSANIIVFSTRDEVEYSTKMMKCANVEVAEGDGLPDSICEDCAEELCTSYDFINKCEASDKALRCTNLFNEIETKEETDIKPEIVKEEPPDETEQLEDYHFADAVFDTAEQVKTRPSPDTKRQKRKYTKSLVFYENIMRRKLNMPKKLGPVRCDLCGHMANCQSALDAHLRTHSGEKPFSCDICGARFNLKGTMKRHILSHHTNRERKYVCETCGSSFYSKESMQTHLRVHTNERPYACTFCGKTFTQISSIIRHKRTHTGEKPYSCNICKKKFADSSQMKRHKAVHSDEKKFTCNICNKAMKSQNAVKSHMKLHSNEKHNICNFCGMTFTQKGSLKSHIRRIHSEKSGECSICNKTFSDLETHVRKHTGEKPLVCCLCGQCFSSKRSMATHMSFRHTNDGKFKCSIGGCQKKFPATNMLEFHILKHHTNHTPFICHHCSRGFFRSSDLSRHLKLSHSDTISKVPVKISGKK